MKYCYIVFIQNKTSKKLTDKSNTITCKNLLLRSGLFVWELYIIFHKKLGLVSFHSLSILKDSKSGKFVPHFHITSCWPLIIEVKWSLIETTSCLYWRVLVIHEKSMDMNCREIVLRKTNKNMFNNPFKMSRYPK